MRHEITIMNFSNIYVYEDFYKNKEVHFLDCSDIKGTNCYCDSEALKEVARRMQSRSPYGIHFIDSGNYHYLSKLWTDRLTEDFILVVFDHHPDMQPSLFDGLMSCGCWVKSVIDTNQHVKKVILCGTEDSLLQTIEPRYRPYLVCIPESKFLKKVDLSILAEEYPVYISIDKDILSKEEVITNWDQGKTRLTFLKTCVSTLFQKFQVLGIDICGECQNPSDIKAIIKNTKVNLELLNLVDTA